MTGPILVTETEYRKGEAVFASHPELDIRPAPDLEPGLADAVLAARSRAVILGIERYSGPLYEALRETGGADGAIISRFGVGHDGVDKRLSRARHITVTNTPGVLDDSVAELAVWLMGALARNVASLDQKLRSSRYEPVGGVELRGRTLGLIGFGAIGRRVATAAGLGLGMRVLAVGRRSPDQLALDEGRSIDGLCEELGVSEYTTQMARVLGESDVVSLHLPAVPATQGLMDARRLAQVKPGALFVNTARGTLVDEAALYDALAAHRLAGAALDVYAAEPYEPAAPEKDLRTLPNVVLTPHVGSNTAEANARMAAASLANVRHFLAGDHADLTRVDA